MRHGTYLTLTLWKIGKFLLYISHRQYKMRSRMTCASSSAKPAPQSANQEVQCDGQKQGQPVHEVLFGAAKLEGWQTEGAPAHPLAQRG